MHARNNTLAAVNVTVAVGCFALIAFLADPVAIWQRISGVSVPAIVAAVALHALIIGLLAWRWRIVVSALGIRVSSVRALVLTFTSTALNLLLPTSVGGDLGRIWMARRDGVDAACGAAAALFDRVVGLLMLIVMIVGGLAFSVELSGDGWGAVVAAMTVTAIAGLLALAQMPRLLRHPSVERFSTSLRLVLTRPALLISTAAISLACHLLTALIVWIVAQGMGVEIRTLTVILFVPVVILASMIPVSVGGWGVRELAAIAFLERAGVAAESAAALAIILGITQLIAAGLGALLGFAQRAPIRV